ncbi:MAG: acyl-CoA dehydrogenase family protein [Burkholderiaceae bacterium]
MDFAHAPHVVQLQSQLRRFIDDLVLPAHAQWQRYAAAGVYPLDVVEPLKHQARALGLWNLFLPGLRADEPGTRLSNLDYAPLAEIMGRVPWASEVFNCNAPDTGNIELLHRFATPDQAGRWLRPLLAGEMRSCFAMSEPDVASSDPTNIATSIRRDGDHYVLNGRKWFITGAAHPNCRLAVVMGRSSDGADAPAHARHTLLLVPMDTPGLSIVRNVPVMQQQAIDGQCELALELMSARATERRAFGRTLGDFANVQDWIGHSRVEIDQARLLVLHAAWRMDTQGNAAARVDVAAIKLVAAQLQTRVLDRAMQVFGAMGLTPDTPLAALWSWGRAMRFLDGPDEVHLRTVARAELTRARATAGSTAAYLQRWMPPHPEDLMN